MILHDEEEMIENALVTCDKAPCRHSTVEAKTLKTKRSRLHGGDLDEYVTNTINSSGKLLGHFMSLIFFSA
jgi:hypothetical protein